MKEKARPTLGESLNQIAVEQSNYPVTQEAGETAAEFGAHMQRKIDNAVKEARAKGIKGKIYIQVIERCMPFARNVVQHTIFVRRSRPTPEQSMYLYSHKDGDDKVKFEYCLPEKQHLPWIWTHQKEFTKKYMDDIVNWLTGKLK